MALTPYLKLQKPPFDSIPWDQAINGNMDILDSFAAQYMGVINFAGTWANATTYVVGQVLLDAVGATLWQCAVSHTSAVAPTTFAQDRVNHPTYWTNATTAPPPQITTNIGRNYIHNPLFNVAQRGVGPWTSGYTVDRWNVATVGDTISFSQVAASDSIRTAVGDEAVVSILQNVFTGNAAAGSYHQLLHPIEGIRRLAGKTVTLSFWAACASGALKIGINFFQNYGTGGSPSASAWAFATGQSVTTSTTWTRYSVTVTLPTAVGKTLGTNNNDAMNLGLSYSSGATNNAQWGNIGVQSGTIQLWGVQLEIGSVATPLEKPDPRYDLSNCQRFYQSAQFYMAAYNVTGNGIYSNIYLSTTMRATPSVTVGSGAVTNASSQSVTALSSNALLAQATVVATGQAFYTGTAIATADL